MDQVFGVGVIGTGFANTVQIPGFANHPRFAVKGLAGHTEAKTAQVATNHGISKTMQWHDLVKDDDVDVVSVVSPVFQHSEMVMEAIYAGKDILCEKPMAMNRHEAFEMWDALNKEKRVGMINHEFRYIAARNYFSHLVRSGAIGKIHEFNLEWSTNGRIPARNYPWNWWSNQLQGGGAWGALGSHLVDFVHWTFGNISTVYGQLQTNVPFRVDQSTGRQKQVTTDDTYRVMVKLHNGIEGYIQGGFTRHGTDKTEFIAYGSKGAVMMREDAGVLVAEGTDHWHLVDIPEEFVPRTRKLPESRLVAPFEALLDDFAVGLDTRRSPTPSFEDAYFTQVVLDGVRNSASQNKVIVIDDMTDDF